MCPLHRGYSWSHRPRSRATRRGRNAKGRAKKGCPKSAAEDIIEAEIIHLELRCSEGVLSFARIATTLLHERLPWVTILLYPTASEREECMLAMLFFWVVAVLSVIGAYVIVGGLYLLARRWL